MNIFYIHDNPYVAASAMTNKHVVKMILESAQLLSSAHRVLDGIHYNGFTKTGRKQQQWHHPEQTLYKATHVNHPSAVWARKNSANYQWLFHHFNALSQEYTNRYGKIHATWIKLVNILADSPVNIEKCDIISSMPQAMPEVYHDNDSVLAYRKYYQGEKLKLDVDKNRYQSILCVSSPL